MATDTPLLTIPQVAKHLSCSVETVRSLCARHEAGLPGGLPSHHFGEDPAANRKFRRVSLTDLEAFIESRRTRPQRQADERQGIREAFAAARLNTPRIRIWV